MPTEPLAAIHSEVIKVQKHATDFVASRVSSLESVHPRYRKSAENLLAYAGLRQLDLRRLQLELGEWGLSSLGRCEGHVLSSLRELVRRLEDSLASGQPHSIRAIAPGTLTRSEAEKLLHQHTYALLGPRPQQRHVLIMVTAPDAETPSEQWCTSLLEAGMNVLRINTAHGRPETWRETAERVRSVALRMKREVRVLIDLEGPKIRTAPIKPGPCVMKYRPEKNPFGHVSQALRVPVLSSQIRPELLGANTGGPHPLRVPQQWIAEFRVGDTLCVDDCREKRRDFRITEVLPGAAVVEVDNTTYLSTESVISWRREGKELGRSTALGLEALPGEVELGIGDVLHLWLEPVEGVPGTRNPIDQNSWINPPRLGVELGGVSVALKPGHRVLLDDGKIVAVVEAINGTIATLRVVKALKERVKIRAEKGVNFPDSEVEATALSDQDRTVLKDVLAIADVVGISFVRSPTDLHQALAEISEAGKNTKQPGVVVKLETAYAFQSLPELLLEAMRQFPVGVMIARGDLAVEAGFVRLAEVQQEILWFCEAANLPVIWATQVLDTLARTGIPSRAEITDASMSVQAECVMLNKGPYVAEACKTLDVILRKMEQHQYKKRNLYRPLHVSTAMGSMADVAEQAEKNGPAKKE